MPTAHQGRNFSTELSEAPQVAEASLRPLLAQPPGSSRFPSLHQMIQFSTCDVLRQISGTAAVAVKCQDDVGGTVHQQLLDHLKPRVTSSSLRKRVGVIIVLCQPQRGPSQPPNAARSTPPKGSHSLVNVAADLKRQTESWGVRMPTSALASSRVEQHVAEPPARLGRERARKRQDCRPTVGR